MVQTAEKTALAIRVLAANFIKSMTPKLPDRKRDHMWVKPSHSCVKVNVDATFHADTLSGACGAVVRDDHGDFVAAASWFLPHTRNQQSYKP